MFYLRNKKHVPCFYRVIETQVEVWENEKCCGKTLFETHFGVYHVVDALSFIYVLMSVKELKTFLTD